MWEENLQRINLSILSVYYVGALQHLFSDRCRILVRVPTQISHLNSMYFPGPTANFRVLGLVFSNYFTLENVFSRCVKFLTKIIDKKYKFPSFPFVVGGSIGFREPLKGLCGRILR